MANKKFQKLADSIIQALGLENENFVYEIDFENQEITFFGLTPKRKIALFDIIKKYKHVQVKENGLNTVIIKYLRLSEQFSQLYDYIKNYNFYSWHQLDKDGGAQMIIALQYPDDNLIEKLRFRGFDVQTAETLAIIKLT